MRGRGGDFLRVRGPICKSGCGAAGVNLFCRAAAEEALKPQAATHMSGREMHRKKTTATAVTGRDLKW